MDYKKTKAPVTTLPQNVNKLEDETGNIYETLVIISKRSNQISIEMKDELNRKLEEFSSYNDNQIEEIFENREQIEISKFYERLPKPTLIALQEFYENKIYYRNPDKPDKK